MDPLASIVVEATVPIPPRSAFMAFTAHMGQWWDPMLTADPASFSGVDLDPSGEVALRHGSERVVFGAVTTWDPPSAYAQTFWLGHPPEHPTTLEVAFAEAAEGTRVRLEHGGWTEHTAPWREGYDHWEDLVARFAAHAAR